MLPFGYTGLGGRRSLAPWRTMRMVSSHQFGWNSLRCGTAGGLKDLYFAEQTFGTVAGFKRLCGKQVVQENRKSLLNTEEVVFRKMW